MPGVWGGGTPPTDEKRILQGNLISLQGNNDTKESCHILFQHPLWRGLSLGALALDFVSSVNNNNNNNIALFTVSDTIALEYQYAIQIEFK